MYRSIPAFALAAAAALLLAACGGGPNGGATTCGTYQSLDSSDRVTAIIQMIKQHGNDTSEGNVGLTEMSVDAFCLVHPSNATISGVYQG
jgi:hypothetical protein